MGSERPPLDEQKSLWEATVSREGVTTGAGAGAGNSFIDAGLIGSGATSFVSMLAVLYPGQPTNVDSMDITAFNNATGEVTLAKAYKGVAAAIPAGVSYKIVTFRFVPAEVAALAVDIGDASTAALGSLFGILGDPAQTFLAMIGYEGATALAAKLTAARAALLDQITALRMAELDPANIPADIDTLLTRVTAAVALASVCTEARLAELAAANIPADIDTLLTRVTAAVALASVCTEARLAELAAANIPADVDELKASKGRLLQSMDFWSDLKEEIAVTGAQSTIAITGGNVVVADLPAGATIVRAVAMMKFRMVENTNVAANKLDAAAALPMQVDDVANTGWLTCIDFVDDAFTLAASTREGGDVIIGDIDIAARIDGNDTYDFQWLNAKADVANLQFNDVQMGIRIWYSV